MRSSNTAWYIGVIFKIGGVSATTIVDWAPLQPANSIQTPSFNQIQILLATNARDLPSVDSQRYHCHVELLAHFNEDYLKQSSSKFKSTHDYHHPDESIVSKWQSISHRVWL